MARSKEIILIGDVPKIVKIPFFSKDTILPTLVGAVQRAISFTLLANMISEESIFLGTFEL